MFNLIPIISIWLWHYIWYYGEYRDNIVPLIMKFGVLFYRNIVVLQYNQAGYCAALQICGSAMMTSL